MDGSFTSGRFRFQVESSDWVHDEARGFNEDLYDDGDLGLRLAGSGRVPDLGGAPLASWLLARLARLTDGRLGLAGEEHNDGGGYVVEFVVYAEPEQAVASFQLQADMEGAGVVGQRVADCPAEEVLGALAAALLAAPDELMARELAVRDPEWELDPEMYKPRPVEGTCNQYGWDGQHFLGKDNVRDADHSH
jgi:hypothetical protein